VAWLAIAGAAAEASAWNPAVRCAGVNTVVHIVRPGDNLVAIASHYRDRTGYYALTDLISALRTANDLDGDLLRPGRRLVIPVAAAVEPPRVVAPSQDGGELRGIYLTAPVCGGTGVFERVDAFVRAGGNAVVFDIKDIDGAVAFRSREPLAAWGRDRSAPVISDLPELLRRLRARDLYIVARIALFLDGELGRRRPDLALKGPDGGPWTERGLVWLDPARAEVQDYLTGLAAEVARAGVDEIQLDYVRYPTNGWRGDDGAGGFAATDSAAVGRCAGGDSVMVGELATPNPTAVAARRSAVIAGFLGALATRLEGSGVKISADVYGIAAWERTADLAVTGQHVPTLAAHVDYLCPMIYPSHFGPGFEGHANPADEPEHFIAEGVRRFRALAGDGARIRPWLQGFPWRVTDYDASYVARQVAAADTAGAAGWCLWNPTGRYDVALGAFSASAADTGGRPLVAYIPPADSDADPALESRPAAAAAPAPHVLPFAATLKLPRHPQP
jgi:hypothetical protein